MPVEHLMALHSLCFLQPRRLHNMMAHFGDAETAWNSPAEWGAVYGISDKEAETMRSLHPLTSPAAVYENFCKAEAQVVLYNEENYPTLLKNIADPPYLLYYKGTLPQDSDLCIAMVGARNATAYGKQAAESLSKSLGAAGVWVVSGLARGIDSVSHRGAIAGGGKTVGILGCGVDVIYPRENKSLYAETAAHGAVVSEFPIGTVPIPMHFPMRNRLISGLCRGVVVVEAAQKSGTQITVDFALEQNRDVFAVPGPIFSNLSRGTHMMIKNQHAKLVGCVEDILDEYKDDFLEFNGPSISQPVLFGEAKPAPKGQDRKLVSYLSVPRHFDEIAREFGLQAAQLARMLTMAELSGLITPLEGRQYIAKH